MVLTDANLHLNIQENGNEHGVFILSPSHAALGDGSTSILQPGDSHGDG